MYTIRRIASFLAFVLFILGVSCSRKPDDKSSATWQAPKDKIQTISVEAMRVTKGLLIKEIRSAGLAEGIREVWILSETEGIIQDLHFRLGDIVQEGDTLLSIERGLAEQNRNLAKGQYQTALLEYQAAEQSKTKGGISNLQFSQVTDRLLAAKTALFSAEDNYENTIIKAPFTGAIASRNGELVVGNYLSRGVRVARIVDYSAFRTEVSVGEGEIFLVQKGSPVKVTGNDGLVRSGRVSAVSAGIDNASGSFIVEVEWEPLENDRLKSGMTVHVSIKASGGKEHIIAPSSSIRIRNGEQFVFVDTNKTAESRKIETGNRLGERVEVLSGLDLGDVVIISGIASLTPNAPVQSTVIGNNGEIR